MSPKEERLSICAIIAARNELHYLNILLPLLAEQRIDVIIVDNESTDGSSELYSGLMGKPIITVETLPYRGSFSLSEQLSAKQELCKTINHDWVIHHDADEIMEHHKPGLTLRDAIQEADRAGYNILNFEEFVFLPEPNSNYFNRNYYAELLRYYFFEPKKNRLNRAWKRSSQLSNTTTGGHILKGSYLSVAPTNHILRHYIALSGHHAKEKYLGRDFDPKELAKRWHNNRLNFTKKNLLLPDKNAFLFRLNRYDSKDFCRTKPANKHFWQWNKQPIANLLKLLGNFFKTR
jgi:glycosyltransferase involved in cell wall biosynthesis